MNKHIAIFILAALAIGGFVYAAPSVIYQRSLYPETNEGYGLGTSTQQWLRVHSDGMCLTNDCITSWAEVTSATGWSTTSEDFYWDTNYQTEWDTLYIATSTFSDNLLIDGYATATDYYMPDMRIDDSTYSSFGDFFDLYVSAGRVTGGTVTDGGSETVDVAVGTGFIRIADDDVSDIKFFDWAASSTISITTDTIRYVGVEYNSGSPRVALRTTENWDFDTDFPLAKVINDGGSIHILNNPWWTGDGMTNTIERFQAAGHLVRDEHIGGLQLSVPGTRNIAVTAGTLWSRLNEFEITAIDTSVSGNFEMYWYDGVAGEWKDIRVTQYDNTAYNDTSLAATTTMNNNWYANWWVYAEADDDEIALVYPQAQYSSAAAAEAESPPTLLSDHHTESSILIGRIVFREGVDAPVEVQTVWETTFNAAQASDHGNLAGLSDDDHTQYGALAQNETVTGDWSFTKLTVEYVTSTQKLVIGSTNPINDAVLFITGDSYFDGNSTTTGNVNIGGNLEVTGQLPNRYVEEDESANCDGATTVFTTSNSIATSTEQVVWNGNYLNNGTDYNIGADNTTITMAGLLNTYPCISGDELIVNYRTP